MAQPCQQHRPLHARLKYRGRALATLPRAPRSAEAIPARLFLPHTLPPRAAKENVGLGVAGRTYSFSYSLLPGDPVQCSARLSQEWGRCQAGTPTSDLAIPGRVPPGSGGVGLLTVVTAPVDVYAAPVVAGELRQGEAGRVGCGGGRGTVRSGESPCAPTLRPGPTVG